MCTTAMTYANGCVVGARPVCSSRVICGLSFNTLCLLFSVALAAAVGVLGADQYNRADFPADFVFGSGTAAYQEDIKLMSDIGLEAFRITISWSRLIPNGRGPVNPLGLRFYNNFINELISHGIQPHVALHHADLPQVLEDEYDGWISRKIVKDFTAYADVCFREFGDRVLYWTTVNEANIFVIGGYDQGLMPPGRCSIPFSNLCSKGNSTTEPYLVGHNILLAHSAIVKLYKEKYKATQKGYIGFNIYNLWMVPYSNSKEDVIATQRANDFYTVVVEKKPPLPLPDEYPVHPWGLYGLLEYLKQVYGNPSVYVHENGQKTRRNQTLDDTTRVDYLHGYIGAMLDALRNGSNTKGYFTWSLLDCLELLDGFDSSFGMCYVDLDDKDLKRYPKLSARWYSNFLNGKSILPSNIAKQGDNFSVFL